LSEFSKLLVERIVRVTRFLCGAKPEVVGVNIVTMSLAYHPYHLDAGLQGRMGSCRNQGRRGRIFWVCQFGI